MIRKNDEPDCFKLYIFSEGTYSDMPDSLRNNFRPSTVQDLQKHSMFAFA